MSSTSHPVSVPLYICDAYASEHFKGNQTAVCMVPSSVYCMEWSGVKSLEASFGRGEPDHTTQTEEERAAEAQAYADERDAKMGRAFQSIARELNVGECAFVYRIPAAREKDILDKIRVKVNEFEKEYEERVREEESRQMNALLSTEEEGGGRGLAQYEAPAGMVQGVSFSITSFGASFLQTQQMSMIASGNTANVRRPRRMYTQWFGLRWFTPMQEHVFCGQAAIAAAHTIFECARFFHLKSSRHLVNNVPVEFFIPTQTDVLCFVTRAGIISVRYKETNGAGTGAHHNPREGNTAVETYEVHFPANEAVSVQEMLPSGFKAGLAEALGLANGAADIDDIALSAPLSLYVAVLKNAAAVRHCRVQEAALRGVFTGPDFTTARQQHPRLATPHALVITAENDGGEAQILTRVFTPWIGVLEDSVSSFAYTALLPFWLRRLNGSYKVGDKLVFYQASKRGGSVRGIIIGKKADRVALIGSVITFLRGNAMFDVED
ncbi:unnamed protein product [Phytomonas sp. EM1]|nr:unnamed protein product [Phytomonas sp. EM1]|eukprot:CCW63954.1 unnamed protein product [Phytomonas sp. isolate EM1]